MNTPEHPPTVAALTPSQRRALEIPESPPGSPPGCVDHPGRGATYPEYGNYSRLAEAARIMETCGWAKQTLGWAHAAHRFLDQFYRRDDPRLGIAADRPGDADLLDTAWGVIANVNWDGADPHWRRRAETWRDEYHASLPATPVPAPDPGALAGLFVSFEGGEGAGKTTQIQLLTEALEAAGHAVMTVREPGGTPIGEVVRHLLKHHPDNGAMTKAAELLLFAASRAQLVKERLEPFLKKGGVVLADRFLDSTTAYQGGGRDLPADLVAAVNGFAVGGCRPHVTFLLDVESSAGLARARGREPGVRDRMEEEKDAFYATIRQSYLDIAAKEPERFVVLDATRTREDLHAAIMATLAGRRLLPEERAVDCSRRTGDVLTGPEYGDPCVGGGTAMLL